MARFEVKVGDKVRRLGSNIHGFNIGDVCVIQEVNVIGNFLVESGNGFSFTYAPDTAFWEKVSPDPEKPEWANWKAMDRTGWWGWFEKEPEEDVNNGVWDQVSGKFKCIHHHPKTDIHWIETLTYVGKEEKKSMEINDLKAGMRVELRNHEMGLLIGSTANTLILLREGDFFNPISLGLFYSKKLQSISSASLDIMKVWSGEFMNAEFTCNLSNTPNTNPSWERKEVKEIDVNQAMEDLKDIYGCEVKLTGVSE